MVSDEKRRRFYRLNYPERERPILSCELGKFTILDISEEGLRIALPLSHQLSIGSKITGRIDFESGAAGNVRGVVIRIDSERSEGGLQLSKGLPLKLVIAEERRLLQKYPGVKF